MASKNVDRIANLTEQITQDEQAQEKNNFKREVKWAHRELARLERIDAGFWARQKEVLEVHFKLVRDEVELQHRLSDIELEEERAWLAEDVVGAEKEMEERHRVELEQLRVQLHQIKAEKDRGDEPAEENEIAEED